MHHVDLRVPIERIRKAFSIARLLAVNEDDDVAPERALLVENVFAHAWMSNEVGVEGFEDRNSCDRVLRTLHVASQVRRECNARHAPSVAREARGWFPVRSGLTNARSSRD